MRFSLGWPSAGSFFGLVFLATLLAAGRNPVSTDAAMSLRAAQLWLDTGSIALAPGDFANYSLVVSPDGKQYSKYPALALVNCIPAAWFVKHCGTAPLALGLVALTIVPALWTAVMALGLTLLLIRVGIATRVAMLMSAWSIVSTPLWVYSRGYYAEMPQAALLIWALLAAELARDDERLVWLAGLAVGLAATAKATFLVLVPCVVLSLPVRYWHRFALGLLPGAAIVAGYNYARYQNIFAFGYGSERDGTISFGTPLLVGLFGNLLSPGKSVFLYAPLLLAAPWGIGSLLVRARRFWLLAWALPTLMLVALASKWWAWSGDSAWGPRLLVPLLPWLLLPAWLMWQRGTKPRVVLAVLVTLGALVQIPAMLLSEYTYVDHVWRVTRPMIASLASEPSVIADDMPFNHFVPWLSPILAQAWLVLAKLWGSDALGTPPWAANGFDKLASVPELPAWNWWFDGSPVAIALALGLGAAWIALLAQLLRTVRVAAAQRVAS